MRTRLIGGSGWVGRFGSTVCWSTDRPVGRPVEEFLDAVRDSARDGAVGAQVTRRIIRWLAGVATLSTTGADGFGLAVVAPDEHGLAMLAWGDVQVTATLADTTEVYTGNDAANWVDRLISGDLRNVVVSHADHGAQPDRLSRLDGGIVPAGGFEVGADLADDQPPGPPPAPPAVEEADPAEHVPVEVLGRLCGRGHFNHPAAMYCARDGYAMWHVTTHLVPGPRPHLGVLVADGAKPVAVYRDLLIGRDPASVEPPAAWAGAHPQPLADPTSTMSRIHIGLRLEGWDVLIADVLSANGTFIRRDETEWQRIGTDPVPLVSGTEIRMGSRTAFFGGTHQVPLV